MKAAEAVPCRICGRSTDRPEKHHLVPRSRGPGGEIAVCCRTCARQVHMLFTDAELAAMSLGELRRTPAMQEYIRWVRKRPGDFRVRPSRRVKRRR